MPDCRSAIWEIPKYSFEYGPHWDREEISCGLCAFADIPEEIIAMTVAVNFRSRLDEVGCCMVSQFVQR